MSHAQGFSPEDLHTDALVDELLNRATHIGLAAIFPGDTPDHMTYVMRWKGDPHMITGLLQDLTHLVLQHNDTVSDEEEQERCGNA